MIFAASNIPITLLFIAALAFGLALFSWQHRYLGAWASSFALMTLAASIWSLGYAFEIGSSSLPMKISWARFEYLGIATVPVAWFLFALQYTGRAKSFARRRLPLLVIIPVLTILLVFTNEAHHLIWQTAFLDNTGSFSNLIVTYGTWFWINLAYSYLLMLGGTLILFRAFFRFDNAFRWQNGILLLAALTPWVGNALYLTNLSPVPGLDLSPFGLGITGLLLAVGIFRFKLFDLVPVARRVAVENMDDGIVILDLQNRIVDINPAAKAIFGQDIIGLVGQSLVQVPFIGGKLVEMVRDVSQITTEFEVEQQGIFHCFDLRISSLLDNKGRVNGRLLTLRDITQRRQTERALVKRTQLLETLNLLSKDITSSLDLQLILNTIVKSATQFLEVTSAYISDFDEEQGTAITIAEYFAPQASELERVSDLGVTYDLESDFGWEAQWIHDPTNNYVVQLDDLKVHAKEREHIAQYGGKTMCEVPLYAKGKLVGTLELWESRQKREFSRDDMVLILAIAQQAALALSNAQLYEQALSASRLKSRLLAQINHELRTPLSVILLYSEMLEDGIYGSLSKKQTNSINKVIDSANYLHSLVEQLLIQAEVENGKVKLKNEPFAPAELVEQVLSQLRVLADAKGLNLISNISPDMLHVSFGDPKRIQQILINLVSNAIKYTEQGSVSLCLFQPDANRWAIQVSDTGIGIPTKDQIAIFEPFWQVSGTEMQLSRNGTGLGLSIVQQLVELMEGQISIESEVGKGSTFTVFLPLTLVLEESTVAEDQCDVKSSVN